MKKLVRSFVFSLIYTFISFSIQEGELSIRYWNIPIRYGFIITVVILTIILYFLIERKYEE